jgi:hypothetical protein
MKRCIGLRQKNVFTVDDEEILGIMGRTFTVKCIE